MIALMPVPAKVGSMMRGVQQEAMEAVSDNSTICMVLYLTSYLSDGRTSSDCYRK